MNSVVLAVLVMFFLSVARVHVVISLFVGALLGGWAAGMSLEDIVKIYQTGLSGGAAIALTYALLGVFAVSLSHSGLPQWMAEALIKKVNAQGTQPSNSSVQIRWWLVGGLLIMGLIAETLVPIHIAFVFMVIPSLLAVMNALQMDRRLMACVLSCGLVAGYMMFPIGFGSVYLNDILLKRISEAGLDVSGISTMKAMLIPGLGMLAGLAVAALYTYRKPRIYQNLQVNVRREEARQSQRYRVIVALIAVVLVFLTQLKLDSMLMGALVGTLVFMACGVVPFKKSESVFNEGVNMMAMIGLIMISACGFAEVMKASGDIEPLVQATAEMFAGSKLMAAFAMLLVGLIITMGIGSSFSTIPIIATIYVPLCASMGFSTLATVCIIGTAGALGDTGSPASDSTLAPSGALNVDGQHDHIRDTVIPTFLHFNIPLLLAGWLAAMIL